MRNLLNVFCLTATWLLFLNTISYGACHVVDDSAAGGGNGDDWTTAWQALPATLVRGDTYYLADGTYPKYVANTAVSGVTLITVKKAIGSDHCTDTGWNLGTMGSAVATITDSGNNATALLFQSNYWMFDGQTRTSLTTGHGIAITVSSLTGTVAFTVRGLDVNNITLKYIKAVGSGVASNNPTCNAAQNCILSDPLYFSHAPDTGLCHDLTFQYMYLYDSGVNAVSTVNCSTVLLEHSMAELNGTGSYYHGQGWNAVANGSTYTIRYNHFKDIQGTAVFSMIGAGTLSNWEVYGNNVYESSPVGTPITNGVYACLQGNTCDNLKFYNNSIANTGGISYGAGLSCRTDGGASCSGWLVKNNLWYNGTDPGFRAIGTNNYNTFLNVTPVYSGGSSAGANDVVTDPGSDPFVSSGAGDFHPLSGTAAGETHSAPYATDLDGVTRGGDGTWDRGAFEFVASGVPVFQTVIGTSTLRMGLGGGSQTVTVTNVGTGSTDGTTATFMLTLPTGVTATALSGTGWGGVNCTPSGLTCTRSDVLTATSSYPVLTLTYSLLKSTAQTLMTRANGTGGGTAGTSTGTGDITATAFKGLGLAP